MVSLDEFFPRIKPYVIGATDPLVEQAVLETCIDFCDYTNVITYRLDAVYTSENVQSYKLDLPNNAVRLSRILTMAIDGKEIDGIVRVARGRYTTMKGKPVSYFVNLTDETTVNFIPTPDQQYVIEVEVALTPSANATVVDDQLFYRYTRAIVSGAISRLCLIPEMPFSNLGMSRIKEQEYLKFRNEAKLESYYGQIRGSDTIQARPLVR